MSIFIRIPPALALVLFATSPALAYVGPGAGLTLLAAFWALVVAVASAIGFLVLWPLRRRLRRGRQSAMAQGRPANRSEPNDSKVNAPGR